MLTRPLRAPATIAPGASPPSRPRLQVVLFSGGRGSRALAQQLVGSDRVDVTLVINGYDDGASTGEVRRFLGDCLGPSDFRKNASRVAAELNTAPSLIALVDHRLPVGCDTATATAALAALRHEPADGEGPAVEVRRLVRDSPPAAIDAVADRLDAFFAEMRRTGVPFDFSDCAIGNLVFAGCFLRSGRRFNDAVDDYGAAARRAARPSRERHRRHQRLPRRDRRQRRAAGERGGDRQHPTGRPDPRDLPRRSARSTPAIRRSPASTPTGCGPCSPATRRAPRSTRGWSSASRPPT